MALTESYLQSTKNLPSIMDAIQAAGVPDKFSYEFLKTLGFSSSNDRSIIAVLKSLGFIDGSGKPLEPYRAYKNKTIAKKVLGKAIKNAYEDIFLANENAQNQSYEKIKGIIAAATGKGDSVVEKMASTFKSLCSLAEFTDDIPNKTIEEVTHEESKSLKHTNHLEEQSNPMVQRSPTFHYNIQIHLPVTKDISVYNAIFKSIKEHLM